MVHLFTACLLRRHRGRCAHYHTSISQVWCGVSTFIEFSETKIQHFYLAAPGDHNVSRFDITMNDASLMSCRQGFGNLQSDWQQFFQIHRSPIDKLSKGLAFDILHGYEQLILGFTHLMNGADIRMVQCGREPRLAQESQTPLGVSGEKRIEEFQGDFAAKPGVVSEVD